MKFSKKQNVMKVFFIILVFIFLFNPIAGTSSHVLTTRNSVVDITYSLYRNCNTSGSTVSTSTWTSQASGCQPEPGNVNQPLTNVYLGIGGSVPPSIASQYPGTSAGYLEYWKTQMVGLELNEFKSFIVPSSQGYNDGDLYFEIRINRILNPETASHQDSSSSSVTDTSDTQVPGTDNSLVFGVVILAIIGSGGVLAFFQLNRTPSVKTEEIISKSKVRESEKLQSLKDVISERDIKGKEGGNKPSIRPKTSKSRRRR